MIHWFQVYYRGHEGKIPSANPSLKMRKLLLKYKVMTVESSAKSMRVF